MKRAMLRGCVPALFLAGVMVLSSCGSGGGGGDGGSAFPASYTGSRDQAAITPSNAVTTVTGAWNGGASSFDLAEVTPLATNSDTPAPGIATDSLVRTLADMVGEALPGAAPQIRPLVLVTDTMPGDCGGSAAISLDVNETTGSFTGTITFSSYCSAGTTLDGTVPVSGQVDLGTLNPTRLTMTFHSLRVVDATEDWTLVEGTATLVMTSDLSSETDTLNLAIRNNLLQKTFWINNYVIHVTIALNQATLTGRYYDPDYGYVDISTLAPLDTSNTLRPASGVLLFTGSLSQARLTFAATGDLLEIDANNDGTFEASVSDPFSAQ